MLGRLTDLAPAGPRKSHFPLRSTVPVGVPGKSYPFRSSVLCSGQKDRPEEASQQGPSDRADASGNWFSGFARMGDVLMKLMRNGSAVPEPDTPPVEQTLIPDLSEELDARYEELHQEMKTDEKVKERMRLYIPSGAQTRVEFPKGSGKMYINPHIIQLPGPALNRKERMAARFQEKFGIPFPQLDEDEKGYILNLLFAVTYKHPELCLLAAAGIKDPYAAYAAWQMMLKYGAARPSDLRMTEPSNVVLSDELLARRKERRIARKEPTKKLSLKKLPPKKGFGAAKPVKQETRGLNGDDLIWDLSEREEYVRTMREQFECLREVMGLTDKYLAKLVEASFATYHFLRLGILLWMASQESKLWFSSSAVAILIGANQAPRGKWSQEWADEGLWPNHEDVVEEFEAFEGEIIAEFCLERQGITGEVAAILMGMMSMRAIALAAEELREALSEIMQVLSYCAVALAARDAFGARAQRVHRDTEIVMDYLSREFEHWKGDRLAKAPLHIRLARETYMRALADSQQAAARAAALRAAAQAIAAAAKKRADALEAEAAAAEVAAREAAEKAAQEQAAAAKAEAEAEARRQEEEAHRLAAEAAAASDLATAQSASLASEAVAESIAEAAAAAEAATEESAEAAEISVSSLTQEDTSSEERTGETLTLEPSTSGRLSPQRAGPLLGRPPLRRPLPWQEDEAEEYRPIRTYIARELTPDDRRVYKAAGVIPYMFRPVDNALVVLVAIAPNQNNGQDGYTFLGGKRNLFDASAEATAVRELAEESAGLLSGYDISADRLGPVLWYPKGLYAAYLQELGPEYHDLPERYAHMMIRLGSRAGKSEPVALTWLEVARLDEFRRQSFKYIPSFFLRVLKQTALVPWLKDRQTRPRQGQSDNSALRRRHKHDRLPPYQRLRGSLAQFAEEIKAGTGQAPSDQVGKSFSWPGREGDEEASDSSVTDGLGVSLELLMGRNTGMGPMAEQWNNGAVLSGPNLTQRGPLYNIRPTIPGSAFSCRVFHFMPDGMMHETQEDKRVPARDWGQLRSPALISILPGASTAYLPAAPAAALRPPLAVDARAAATLFPAGVASCLPEGRYDTLQRPRERPRVHVHDWDSGRQSSSSSSSSSPTQRRKGRNGEANRPRPSPAMTRATASPGRSGGTPRRRRPG